MNPAAANTSHPRDGMTLPHEVYPHTHAKFVNGADFFAQDPSQLYTQKLVGGDQLVQDPLQFLLQTPLQDPLQDPFASIPDWNAVSDMSSKGPYSVEQASSNNYSPLPKELGYNVSSVDFVTDGVCINQPQVQPPYTPEASPPTPSANTEAMSTRSRLSVTKPHAPIKTKGVRSGRVTKNSKESRQKKTSSILSKPLSEIAKDMPHVPVADIDAYVSRSVEHRLQETARNKKPGQVKRPMNAFMLYRKAYQEVAKTQCSQNNHQLVSKVCGAGWPMEPDEVHDKFTGWAKMERTNHQAAHPGYKFTPSKPRKGRAETDGESTIYSDLDDAEWGTPNRFPRGASKRPATRQVSRLSETPSLGYETFSDPMDSAPMPAYQDMYPYPMPVRTDTLPYSHVDPGTYDPRLYHSHVDHMHYLMPRHTSPGLEYTAHHHMNYNPKLLDGYYRDMVQDNDALAEGAFPGGGLLYDDASGDLALTADHAWHTHPDPHADAAYETGPTMANYATSAQDAYLRGKNEDWKVQELQDEAGQFEDWIIQTEQGLL